MSKGPLTHRRMPRPPSGTDHSRMTRRAPARVYTASRAFLADLPFYDSDPAKQLAFVH